MWILSDHRLIGGLPPPNRPYRKMYEYGAFRSIFPCLPSAGIIMAQTPLTAEFDYRWQHITDGRCLHEPSLRENTKW